MNNIYSRRKSPKIAFHKKPQNITNKYILLNGFGDNMDAGYIYIFYEFRTHLFKP